MISAKCFVGALLQHRIVILLLSIACFSRQSYAADLTAEQSKSLATVDLNLKRAERDIPLVEQALGSGTPSASQLRLAASRIGGPKSLITQLDPMMTALPADHASVQPVKARFDAAKKKLADLEAKITTPPSAPSATPTPTAAPSPTPINAPAGVMKLDYRGEATLKDALYNIGEVEGRANAVEEVVKKVEATKDANAVDFRTVNDAISTIADARVRAKNGDSRLSSLPQDAAGVSDAVASMKRQVARLDSAEKTLKPVYDKLGATVNPGSYPSLEEDFKRLGELAAMYSNEQVLQTRFTQAAELVNQSAAAAAEKARIMSTYGALLQQQTDVGQRLTGVSTHFDNQFGKFSTAAQKEKASLPGEIKSDIDGVTKLADQAVAEQKPAFFSGGIADRLERIDDKLVLYTALDPAGAPAAKKQVADLRTSLKSRMDKLKEGIITSNELPPDRYQGADRAELEKLAGDAWKKIQPDAKVLAYRIPSQDWVRETMWRNQNATWYRIDRSKVQVQLLVQQDGRVAVNRPVDLWKDHMQKDQINAVPMDDKQSEILPQRLILLSKIK